MFVTPVVAEVCVADKKTPLQLKTTLGTGSRLQGGLQKVSTTLGQPCFAGGDGDEGVKQKGDDYDDGDGFGGDGWE